MTESDRHRTRGELILAAAIEAIGRKGVDGASLRHIARDAGVSLTLIHHHFASKPSLVRAAISSLHQLGDEPLARLRTSLEQGGELPLATIVAAWVQYGLDLFGRRARHDYLALMLRLQTDPAIDAMTASTLDPTEPLIRKALARGFPDASHEAIDFAWRSASGALYAVVLNDRGLAQDSPDQWEHRALLETFLHGGIVAAMDAATQGVFA